MLITLQCDRVPESILDLEREMRQRYEPEYRRYNSEVDAWLAARRGVPVGKTFEECETPGQQAACDLSKFMDRYYLTDGKPDPAKTPEPMTLEGYPDRWELLDKVQTIPGLYALTALQTFYGKPCTMCIGWDRSKVFALVRDVKAKADDEKKQRMRAMWDAAMEKHHQFMSRCGRSNSAQPEVETFDLANCAGSYIVECALITEGWPDDMTEVLTMDITKPKNSGNVHLTAALDFKIFKGTMLLTPDRKALRAMVATQMDTDDNDEDYEKKEDQHNSEASVSGKRTAPLPVIQPGKKQKTNSGAASTPRPDRRLYFRLRGRETGEGEILPYPEPGHIDFLDDGCSSFAGVARNLEQFGGPIRFRGYKVSKTAKRAPENWGDFDFAV